MKCDYYNSKNSDTLSSSLNIRGQKETQQLTLSPYKILELNCCQCKKRKFFLKKMIVPNQANVRLAFSSSEIHSSKTNLSHPFPLTRSSEFFSTNHTMKACSLLKKNDHPYVFFFEYTSSKNNSSVLFHGTKTDPNLPKNILMFFFIIVYEKKKKQETSRATQWQKEDLSNLEHFVFLEE